MHHSPLGEDEQLCMLPDHEASLAFGDAKQKAERAEVSICNIDIVLETEATVERPDSNAAKMQPMCTLGPKGELILFDEHDPFKNITLSVSSKRFPPGGGAGGLFLFAQGHYARQHGSLLKRSRKSPPL
jgi:hypothetical protein